MSDKPEEVKAEMEHALSEEKVKKYESFPPDKKQEKIEKKEGRLQNLRQKLVEYENSTEKMIKEQAGNLGKQVGKISTKIAHLRGSDAKKSDTSPESATGVADKS